jgi:hypothetical protein
VFYEKVFFLIKKRLVLRFAGVEEQEREENKSFFTNFGHCFSTKVNTCADLVYKVKVISLFKFLEFFF